MITCEDCGKQLDYGGRGRPPKYCPAHAKASKRRLDRARPNGGRIRKEYPKCCRDAQAAGVRTTPNGLGIVKANIILCEQHRQWRKFYRLAAAEDNRMKREEADIHAAEVKTYDPKEENKGFRLAVNPDAVFIPDPPLFRTASGTKSGYDVRLEHATAKLLARNKSHTCERGQQTLAS